MAHRRTSEVSASPPHDNSSFTYCDYYHSQHSVMGKSLCGPVETLTISFIAVSIALIVVEYSLHLIEHHAIDTPFEGVVHKIFKEMTCLGVLAFLTVMLNIGANNSAGFETVTTYNEAVHHSDFVIFIMSVAYVIQVSVHMFLFFHQDKVWKISSNIVVADVLQNFDDDHHHGIRRWLPSTQREQLEYHIFFSLFCLKFNIRKSEFNFAGYLSESFKRYILALLDENFYMRIFFCFLIALNVIRVKLLKIGSNCPHDDDLCRATDDLGFFAFCGWSIVLSVLILGFFARLYEIRLMGCAGVSNIHDYREFLMTEESIEVDKLRGGRRRQSTSLGTGDLKETLETLKAAQDSNVLASAKLGGKVESLATKKLVSHMFKTVAFAFGIHKDTSQNGKDGEADDDEEDDEEDDDDDDDDDESDDRIGNRQAGTLADKRKRIVKAPSKRKLSKLPSVRRLEVPVDEADNILSNVHGHDAIGMANQEKTAAVKDMSFTTLLSLNRAKKSLGIQLKQPQQQTGVGRGGGRRAIVQTMNPSKASNINRSKIADFSSIYLFHRPQLYFFSVKVATFFNCAYFAFWCTNFILLPNETNHEAMWHIIILLPCVLTTIILGYIIQSSSIIEALSDLRPDVIGKVIEIEESAERACSYLKEKLAFRLKHFCRSDDLEKHKELITKLIKECDKENKGFINRKGFRFMLQRLDLHFTDKKFKEVMDVIDKDLNGEIVADELFAFIYPDDAFHEDLENRRASLDMLKMIKNVKNKDNRHTIAYQGSLFLQKFRKNSAEKVGGVDEDRDEAEIGGGADGPLKRGLANKQMSMKDFFMGGAKGRSNQFGLSKQLSMKLPFMSGKAPAAESIKPSWVAAAPKSASPRVSVDIDSANSSVQPGSVNHGYGSSLDNVCGYDNIGGGRGAGGGGRGGGVSSKGSGRRAVGPLMGLHGQAPAGRLPIAPSGIEQVRAKYAANAIHREDDADEDDEDNDADEYGNRFTDDSAEAVTKEVAWLKRTDRLTDSAKTEEDSSFALPASKVEDIALKDIDDKTLAGSTRTAEDSGNVITVTAAADVQRERGNGREFVRCMDAADADADVRSEASLSDDENAAAQVAPF